MTQFLPGRLSIIILDPERELVDEKKFSPRYNLLFEEKVIRHRESQFYCEIYSVLISSFKSEIIEDARELRKGDIKNLQSARYEKKNERE